MTATDTQVRIIMRERNQGRTQEQADAEAELQDVLRREREEDIFGYSAAQRRCRYIS